MVNAKLFSVPIFFIVFRETLEAAIIISVLLGLVEQIVKEDPGKLLDSRLNGAGNGTTAAVDEHGESKETMIGQETEKGRDASLKQTVVETVIVPDSPDNEVGEEMRVTLPGSRGESEVGPELVLVSAEDGRVNEKRLMKKLRLQIFFGGLTGLAVALAIGGAFIAVWFTQASDLWSKSEELWEGIFELIASLMIFVMGITMLKLDRAKAKWRVKLQKAFDGQHVDSKTRTGRWILFILPMITVLREGIEAVIFVGGVSLGQPAQAIPIAAIVGLICGLTCGFLIYQFASKSTLRVFLVVMTNFLLLIGAGLFSKAIWAFEENAFNNILGQDVDDTGGDGPGSFNVRTSVWHLDCCNPDNNSNGSGWMIFGAIFGWTNNATLGSVLSYVFYWLAVIAVLVTWKFKEGRTKLFGRESTAGTRRRLERERVEALPQRSDDLALPYQFTPSI